MVPISVVEIVDASFEDMVDIELIYSHYVQNTLISLEEIPPSLEELNNRRLSYQERGLPYLVAKYEGKLVGYAYAAPYRSRSGYRFTVENSVYINPEQRGKGIGSLLLNTLITRCKEQGCHQIIAVISDLENSASLYLHTKLGFKPVGTLKEVGCKFGIWVDTVLMQRNLEE